MAASQIIFNDLPDGRVEVCVIVRDPDPAIPSPAIALARLALFGIGGHADLRTIARGFAEGARMVVDRVLPLHVGTTVVMGCRDRGAVDFTDTMKKVCA